jgi:hypothetical protein
MSLLVTTDSVQLWEYTLSGNDTTRIGHYDVDVTWADPPGNVLEPTVSGKFAIYYAVSGDILPLQESYTYGELVAFRVTSSPYGLTDLTGEVPLMVRIIIDIFDPTGYPVARLLGSTGPDGKIRITTSNTVTPYWPFPPYYPPGSSVFGFIIPQGSAEGDYMYQATLQVDTVLAIDFMSDVVYTSTENRSGSFGVEALRLTDIASSLSDLQTSILESFSGLETQLSEMQDTLVNALADIEANMLAGLEGLSTQLSQVETNMLSALNQNTSEILSGIQDLSAQMLVLEADLMSAIQDVMDNTDQRAAEILTEIDALSDQLSARLDSLEAALMSAIEDVMDNTDQRAAEILTRIDETSQSVVSSLTDEINSTRIEILDDIENVGQMVSSTRDDISDLETNMGERFDTLESALSNATDDITSQITSSVNTATGNIISAVGQQIGDLQDVVEQNFSDVSTFILVLTVLVVISLILVAIATVRVLRLKPEETL